LGSLHANAVPRANVAHGRLRVIAAVCSIIASIIALSTAGAGNPLLILPVLSLIAVVCYTLSAERHARETTVAVARIAAHLRPEDGARQALDAALDDLLLLFGARTVVLVARDEWQGQIYRQSAAGTAAEPALSNSELEPDDEAAYLFDAPGGAWYATTRGDAVEARALAADGYRSQAASVALPDRLRASHRFRSVLAVSLGGSGHWTQRILLFDARVGVHELRMLQAIAHHIAPAIYSIELLGRLRSRLGAAERARVARDLHDGVIQALIGLEMRVHVWRGEANGDPATASKLAHIQNALRTEVLELRELIQQMKTVPVDPKHVLEHLAKLVEQFQRDSGIASHFVSEIDELTLSPHVCEEVVRIVQEALVNVRKHSGARHVLVRVSAPDGFWKFDVDDDGRGFEFAGRRSQRELDVERKGPLIIKERVRAIGGSIAVESDPGHGARIEVWLTRRPRG
jgi:signal transduction histidine kinase